MKSDSDKLLNYFRSADKLQFAYQASSPNEILRYEENCQDIITFLNPVHPHLIQLVGENELSYLNTLSTQNQKQLIEQLIKQGTQYIIFNTQKNIPVTFFQQTYIHLISSDLTRHDLLQYLAQEINSCIARRKSLHGAFVIIFNQGILITGESGSGKSSLLLNLVNQGHLWVADDLSLFYLNVNHQVIGHSSGKLSEFIHIKGIGPVNMDKSYGQASRTPHHPLAAVVHLGNNVNTENQTISAYTQTDKLTLFNENFPMWHLPSHSPNLAFLVENCAKNMILTQWGYDTINGLENALTKTLASQRQSPPRQM